MEAIGEVRGVLPGHGALEPLDRYPEHDLPADLVRLLDLVLNEAEQKHVQAREDDSVNQDDGDENPDPPVSQQILQSHASAIPCSARTRTVTAAALTYRFCSFIFGLTWTGYSLVEDDSVRARAPRGPDSYLDSMNDDSECTRTLCRKSRPGRFSASC